MNPLLPAGLLLLCAFVAAVGVRLVRSTPEGTLALLPDEAELEGEEAPGVLARLRSRAAAALTPQLLSLMSERRRQQLTKRIDAAGRPDGLTLERYVEERAASALLFGVVGVAALVALGNLFLGLLLPAVGWFAYDLRVRGLAKERQEQIQKDLPDFLDVLRITVLAGLGFRRAMGRVARSLGGPLGEEVETTLQQMSVGVPVRQGLEGLRDRNESRGLDQFVGALLQAEELGTPLAQTMTEIADDMRDAFAQDAKERAAKLSPRINVVVILVVLPGAALLLVATLLLGVDFGGLGL
ncbi:type II secretion system F family protein [Nitriliruptoraceae bacterium ZYF776]|nr:type II secretion system F family protein [Profundirhabdus halotolerans]